MRSPPAIRSQEFPLAELSRLQQPLYLLPCAIAFLHFYSRLFAAPCMCVPSQFCWQGDTRFPLQEIIRKKSLHFCSDRLPVLQVRTRMMLVRRSPAIDASVHSCFLETAFDVVQTKTNFQPGRLLVGTFQRDGVTKHGMVCILHCRETSISRTSSSS